MDLTARLERAAEQEETMTDAAKHKVKKISKGMMIGIAAACLLTMGALAAALSPGLRNYFDTKDPGARETLERGIYRLDRSETYQGWTVTLAECVGDDNGVYIWVDVTPPEGTVLTALHGGSIVTGFEMDLPEGVYATSGGSLSALPDKDAAEHQISFCIESHGDNLRGERVTITLDPILDTWYENPGTPQAVCHQGELTAAVRDHEWVFENVLLDYPDQTIRLTPDTEVPYMGGTAVLTKVEISPLGTVVRVEGGACYDHHDLKARRETTGSGPANEIVVSGGGVTITVEQPDVSAPASQPQCWDALTVQLNMADGLVLAPPQTGGGSSCWDGLNSAYHFQEVPYVELRFQYMEYSNLIPPRAIDPSQAKSVTVCGVDIPVE